MGRVTQNDYVEVARSVLDELGGGPLTSKVLVAAAKERKLLNEDNAWVYHHFLKAVRTSNVFDTSKRGYVSFAEEAEPVTEELSEVNVNDDGVVDDLPVESLADPTDPGPIV